MSVPHPGGDPNANLHAQLKRDVLDRVPQVSRVKFVEEAVEWAGDSEMKNTPAMSKAAFAERIRQFE